MEEQEFDRAGTLRTDLKIMISLPKVASNDRNSKIIGGTKWPVALPFKNGAYVPRLRRSDL